MLSTTHAHAFSIYPPFSTPTPNPTWPKSILIALQRHKVGSAWIAVITTLIMLSSTITFSYLLLPLSGVCLVEFRLPTTTELVPFPTLAIMFLPPLPLLFFYFPFHWINDNQLRKKCLQHYGSTTIDESSRLRVTALPIISVVNEVVEEKSVKKSVKKNVKKKESFVLNVLLNVMGCFCLFKSCVRTYLTATRSLVIVVTPLPCSSLPHKHARAAAETGIREQAVETTSTFEDLDTEEGAVISFSRTVPPIADKEERVHDGAVPGGEVVVIARFEDESITNTKYDDQPYEEEEEKLFVEEGEFEEGDKDYEEESQFSEVSSNQLTDVSSITDEGGVDKALRNMEEGAQQPSTLESRQHLPAKASPRPNLDPSSGLGWVLTSVFGDNVFVGQSNSKSVRGASVGSLVGAVTVTDGRHRSYEEEAHRQKKIDKIMSIKAELHLRKLADASAIAESARVQAEDTAHSKVVLELEQRERRLSMARERNSARTGFARTGFDSGTLEIPLPNSSSSERKFLKEGRKKRRMRRKVENVVEEEEDGF